MRGIFGIFHKNGQPVTPETLGAMRAIIKLWGPTGTRAHCTEEIGEEIGFGYSLCDLDSTSNPDRLPITHPQALGLFIIADARIDNREELYEILKIPVSERRTLTDSHLILLGYAKWQKACVGQLVGAFAFVIWDQQRKELFCGRDHMGLRPFFYYDAPGCFVFASDIEAMLACSSVPQKLNEPLLAAHLQEDTYFAEKHQTFQANIFKLPPAHHLSVTKETSRLCRYWSLDNIRDVRLPSNEAYAEQLRDLLFQAVECRIQTNLPIGAHLSGGLDSSTIVAIASQLLQHQDKTLKAYSWSPQPSRTNKPAGNEHDLIQTLCRQYAIDCNYIDLSVEDVVRTYRRDFTRVPYEMMLREELVLQQASQDQVRVMLSGWGGDETVTGHGWGCLSSQFLQGRWQQLHHELCAFTKTSDNISQVRQTARYARLFYEKVLIPLIPEPIAVLLAGRHSRYPESWINPQFADEHREAVRRLRGVALRERPGVQQMQWRWLDNGHITKRLESWAINGARQGVSYRYPLLDRRILEFCLGVPPEQFVQNGWTRSLMRRAVGGILPQEIRWNRSKIEQAAFDVIGQVMVAALPELLEQLQADQHFHAVAQYLDLKRLTEAVDQATEFERGTEALAITLACANVCTKVVA
ncbi:asparagine synthase-related protein [Adonisia turfae]|uniref:asparagine synthase (glutamine-hydrolyzing) n=1 Tax=Adonisia turfae CCMR0081 TaxID=2292702 RepID=A0A6M0RGM1_9CYAN|nr:asparagine synthase-related protein [Adonisia turfae]NEZ55289.1 hypothetical protein [Adonisia turfae CCMR0081]